MTLFDDPVRWSRSAVSTWPRFAFVAVMLALLQFGLIHVAITSGWSGAVSLAAFLTWCQFMFLYALRRLLPVAALTIKGT